MVTFYCPNCWRELDGEHVRVCPACHGGISATLDRRTYVDKLIAALRHSEPATPIRAASLLGALRAREAVPELMKLAHSEADLYQRAAAVEALGQIGSSAAQSLLEELAQCQSVLVRSKARQALGQLAKCSKLIESDPCNSGGAE